MNKERQVQVSDTTEDATRIESWQPKEERKIITKAQLK
jgi:hypothetical protein